MARGNSRAQSEARSPEVLAVRSAMKSGSIKASEAINKDPTLNAVLMNPDVVKAINKQVDSLIESILEDASPGDNSTSVTPETTYFKVGGKMFALELPDIELEYDTEDDSFDYDYGSISSTEEAFTNVMTASNIQDADDLFSQAKIREVDMNSAEGKSLTWSKPYDSRGDMLEMPETKGVEPFIPFDKTKQFSRAKKTLEIYSDFEGKDLEVKAPQWTPEQLASKDGRTKRRISDFKYQVGETLFAYKEEAERAVRAFKGAKDLMKQWEDMNA